VIREGRGIKVWWCRTIWNRMQERRVCITEFWEKKRYMAFNIEFIFDLNTILYRV
jgi:hypothetical protein